MAQDILGSKMSDRPNLKSSTEGYGQNSAQPSSVKVGEACDLAALKATKPDATLDAVKSGFYPHSTDWEQRTISDAPIPVAHGHHKPAGSPSGSVGPVTRPVKR